MSFDRQKKCGETLIDRQKKCIFALNIGFKNRLVWKDLCMVNWCNGRRMNVNH